MSLREPTAPAWRRLLPFLQWRDRLTPENLRADAVAGLVSAVVVLPQGVAFATLAGMPPEYGLYAAMVPAVVAALFGCSWHLVSGPTNVISIFVFASISPLADPGSADYVRLVLTLTFVVGVMQLAMGLARMGTLVNFISHSVVISFTAGAACLIFAAQLKNFFGLDIPRGLSFLATWRELFGRLADINPFVTAVGGITLAVAIFSRRFLPRFPYMISAMIAGSLAALALNAVFGSETTRIATVGALPAGLPPLSAPDWRADTLRQIVPIAFAVTILALTEAVSIARAIAVRSGQRIDGNQEFIGQGLSNLAGAFFSGYASSGSFNRSGLNYEAGARTPLAATLSALLLAVILLGVAPLAAHLPLAVMGAILFIVAWGLIDAHHIAAAARASRAEAVVMTVTFLCTLFADLEFAIYAGVLLSLIFYLTRTSRPAILDIKPDPAPGSYHFSADTDLPDCPQLKMLRVNGSIFFAAVDHVQRAFEDVDAHTPTQRHLLVAATGINFVDLAGAGLLAQEARRRRRAGGGLYFYRMKDDVRAVLERSGALADVGPENVFPARQRPIEHIYPQLDPAVCRGCTARIFNVCRERLPDGTPRAT